MREVRDVQAQPTQRKNTTSTFFPPPTTSFRSRSIGARSPTRGGSATGIGGGRGVSQGWTVSGRDLTDIQSGQALLLLPLVLLPSLGAGCAFVIFFDGLLSELVFQEEKSNVSLGRPTFLRATLVARLENMVFLCGSGNAVGMLVQLILRVQVMVQFIIVARTWLRFERNTSNELPDEGPSPLRNP